MACAVLSSATIPVVSAKPLQAPSAPNPDMCVGGAYSSNWMAVVTVFLVMVGQMLRGQVTSVPVTWLGSQ